MYLVYTRMPGGVTVGDSGPLLRPLSVERCKLPLFVVSIGQETELKPFLSFFLSFLTLFRGIGVGGWGGATRRGSTAVERQAGSRY